MTRPARAILDVNALKHNLVRVRTYAPRSKVMAVIKANAYGHGLLWAARTLEEADALAVASIDEAAQLRGVGVSKPICLLEGSFSADELPRISNYGFEPALHHESQLQALEGAQLIRPVDVWLKVDTGMHRLGFAPETVENVIDRLRRCPNVRGIRIMSHLANADDTADPMTSQQLERFMPIVKRHESEASLANSAGIVAWSTTHLDWVRPGIMLYGVSPLLGSTAESLGLKPVMTLETRLIAVQKHPKDAPIGYGGAYRCPEDMPIGVAAIGYGDGYPRHAPIGTPVLVNGKRVPLIGRVSMDMITLDLRTQPEARVGDRVVLWGKGLPVEEIATLAGTIGYELLCHVADRIPRVSAESTT
jgi:alanine racemase